MSDENFREHVWMYANRYNPPEASLENRVIPAFYDRNEGLSGARGILFGLLFSGLFWGAVAYWMFR